MAEAIIQVLVDNLSSLMKEEIGLIMGVDKEMDKLSSTLTTIQAVLRDAEDKQFESEQIRNWLCKLNDLAFEIDDIVDECATEFSKLQHKNSRINRYSLKNILYRRRIGKRIKEVTEKLDAVAAERSFHLDEMVVQRQSMVDTTRETCSNLDEPDLVYGRNEEMEKIVDILVNQVRDSQQLSVLPIIGIGGLGKTTLAQLVYNHPSITEHFEKRVWICVSDNFDLKSLVEAMIESATKDGSASNLGLKTLDALKFHLRELLNQQRYLLILDDVWNVDQEKWVKLQGVLACGSKGSSIVVTTRLNMVAEIMGTIPAHDLSKLSEEYCWMVFKQRAFGQAMEEHPKLEAIGRQIVKKCSGVPLAAKALGGLLRFKRTEKEWLYIKENEIWNLPHEEALILPALRLSYQHLPLQLRQCFAYCAIYPKDHKMEKEEVIYCWMAHGYISSNGRMDVEDVGDDVWNELVLRSLFQDVTIDSDDGRTIYFKMHDLVHDLAQSIMKNKIRQVSKVKEVNNSCALKNFNRSRVIDASWSHMKNLTSEVDKLKHLRYLNLSGNCYGFRTLPDTVCSLWNLQILNLNYCNSLVELPKRMRYMKNLRHLFLDGCYSLSEMPPKIGELTSLKTLTLFVVGRKSGRQLDELENLNLGGKLEIKHLESVRNHLDAKKANMGNKSNLHHLVLRWDWEYYHINASEQQQEMDEKVLEALEPHSNLEKLEIYGFRGTYFPPWTRMGNLIEVRIGSFPNCSHLPPLGDLPHLKFLCLSNLDALEYVMENEEVNDAILFPSLEKLELSSLPNLRGLLKHEEEVGDIFPNLQELNIRDSPMLKLPPALSSLKKLSCHSSNLNSFPKLGNLTYLRVRFENDTRTCITKILESISNLEVLRLENAKEHNLPVVEEGVQGLKSLTELSIYSCDTLTCLPDVWLRQFTSIEKLSINNCKELVELIPTKGIVIHSLKHLQLWNLPKMVCLPEGLHHMIPSLQSLHLNGLPQLTSLPDWLPNFISLQDLHIQDCRQLTSLPASIQGMTNLNHIWISGCPELKRRCEKEKGEDWQVISHIPFVLIG